MWCKFTHGEALNNKKNKKPFMWTRVFAFKTEKVVKGDWQVSMWLYDVTSNHQMQGSKHFNFVYIWEYLEPVLWSPVCASERRHWALSWHQGFSVASRHDNLKHDRRDTLGEKYDLCGFVKGWKLLPDENHINSVLCLSDTNYNPQHFVNKLKLTAQKVRTRRSKEKYLEQLKKVTKFGL